ncbi:MAG: VWA domain-containing protein [Ignavibacteriales bacterium]|nr:VWA domain-containing protein [Ignavibacteriales bacterium]
MLRFAHSTYLWALLLIPALALAFFFLHHRRKQLLREFVSEPLVAQLAPDASTAKRTVKQALFLFSLACLIVAAANPQVGTRLEEIKREGIDLFIALDVSLSMKAEDIRPSRLEKAKRDVSDLLRKLQGDRVGLVVFAGEAFVQFPLTADYSAADLFLNAVDVEAVPVPGTMIGSAIEVSLKSFRKDLPTQKAIVVVSDGENTEGDVAGAVEKARKEGARVFTIGMGTPEGNPIPIYGASGERVDYKHDRAGNIVLTKLDESALQQIALATGGSYRRATNAGNEIDEIHKELASLQKTEMASLQVTGFEDQFQYPLTLAILLLIIELLLSERRGKFLTRLMRILPVGRVVPLLMIVCIASASAQTVRSHVASGNEAYAKTKYADAEAEYKKALAKDTSSREAQFNLGNAYYKQQRADEAQRIYASRLAASKSPADKEMAYYNIGNTFFKSNKFEESVESYKRSLRLDPKDEDARYNYLLARDRLKKQQDQKKQDKQDKKDNKDNKDKQDQNQQNKQDQQKNQDQQNQDKQDEKNQQQQQQPPQQQQAKPDQTSQQQKNQMQKQQAERILDALRNNEKDIQKKLRKRVASKIIIEKDW